MSRAPRHPGSRLDGSQRLCRSKGSRAFDLSPAMVAATHANIGRKIHREGELAKRLPKSCNRIEPPSFTPAPDLSPFDLSPYDDDRSYRCRPARAGRPEGAKSRLEAGDGSVLFQFANLSSFASRPRGRKKKPRRVPARFDGASEMLFGVGLPPVTTGGLPPVATGPLNYPWRKASRYHGPGALHYQGPRT